MAGFTQGREWLLKIGGIYISLIISIDWLEPPHFFYLAKSRVYFRQVQQMKALNKNHDDLGLPFINTYKFVGSKQYFY